MTDNESITVYYDGACALCRREIAFYKKRAATDIEWCDISERSGNVNDNIAPDLTRKEALSRFHIRTSDGKLRSGAKAFAALWKGVPGFGPLARFVDWKPGGALAEAAYSVFLLIRPVLVAPLNAWDRMRKVRSERKFLR